MTDRHKTGWILGAASVTMITPLAMVLAGRRIAVFEHLGFENGSLPLWWILALIVAGAYVIYTMRAIPLVADMQREISWFKLLGIASAVAGGIVEEAIFRRWIMDTLASGGFPIIAQVAVSAVAFGLAHGLWALVGRDPRSALLAIASTSLLGLSLAIIYLAAGRNLGPCILAHVAINVVIEPWLMLSAVSGRWRRSTDDRRRNDGQRGARSLTASRKLRATGTSRNRATNRRTPILGTRDCYRAAPRHLHTL